MLFASIQHLQLARFARLSDEADASFQFQTTRSGVPPSDPVSIMDASTTALVLERRNAQEWLVAAAAGEHARTSTPPPLPSPVTVGSGCPLPFPGLVCSSCCRI
ncbi:hypothetical protein ZWY2020_055121 [Hordeum vulgare]|nr:hypothetical protein ZWY2020_055121 [Hordeum vulgare]